MRHRFHILYTDIYLYLSAHVCEVYTLLCTLQLFSTLIVISQILACVHESQKDDQETSNILAPALLLGSVVSSV